MKNQDKTELFEKMAVPAAVRQLIIPTIISSLITIIYNLAVSLCLWVIVVTIFWVRRCSQLFALC